MFTLGEISAQQLGLPLSFWRDAGGSDRLDVGCISVALAGAIGFIGLVIRIFSSVVWSDQ
ncbi:hypothetical protein ACNKHL_08960 [Shigella flexneri]